MQPALDGSNRKRQGLGRQFLALALQVAKDNQDAEALGQAIDFFVRGPSMARGARAASNRAVLDSAARRSISRRRRAVA